MDVLWEDLSFETILEKKQRITSRNFPFYVFILCSLSIFSDYKLRLKHHIKENAKKRRLLAKYLQQSNKRKGRSRSGE